MGYRYCFVAGLIETTKLPFRSTGATDAMARRWLARLIGEKAPRFSDVALAAQLLADLRGGFVDESQVLAPMERVLGATFD